MARKAEGEECPWQPVEIGPAADLFLFRFLIIFLRQRGKRGRGRGRREGSERRMVFQQPPGGRKPGYGDGKNRRLRRFHGFKNLQPPFSPPLLTEPVWSPSPARACPSA
jgi:hypothetical protein